MQILQPKTHTWTSEEFYRMHEMGVFNGQRVELLEGEVFDMPAQMNWHAAAIKLTEDALNAAFGPGHWVRVQNTLDLSPFSVVDPDLAVIIGSPRNASKTNPTTALLVVEVSDTTLHHDQTRKASLYARCGIEDYWIVNLVDWRLEVYRQPQPDASQPYGAGYASDADLSTADHVEALALPGVRIAVADLFP